MATNIPPHNLREVVAAIKLVVRDPSTPLAEIMRVLPGPDFPTAGSILGVSGIQEAYATGGRGCVLMRGRYEIEEVPGKKTARRSSSTSCPIRQQVPAHRDIAGLVRDKRIEGIPTFATNPIATGSAS